MATALPVNHVHDPTWSSLQDPGDAVTDASIEDASEARQGAGGQEPADAPPALTSVSPSTVSIAALPANLTLAGTNLAGATATWHLGGASGALTKVSGDASSLVVSFTAAAAAGGPGAYTIDVTGPTGTSNAVVLTVTA